jgi:hypothetical protein
MRSRIRGKVSELVASAIGVSHSDRPLDAVVEDVRVLMAPTRPLF